MILKLKNIFHMKFYTKKFYTNFSKSKFSQISIEKIIMAYKDDQIKSTIYWIKFDIILQHILGI